MQPPEDQIAIESSAFTTWMGSDGIVRTKVKPSSRITIKEATENSKAVNAFYQGLKYPLIVDSRQVHSITKEARDFFSLRGRESSVNAIALIIESPLSRVIGNFFMGLNKPRVPTRLFNSEEAATHWCNQFIHAATNEN